MVTTSSPIAFLESLPKKITGTGYKGKWEKVTIWCLL